MNRTVICHFYNEEYLLPWWLQHHKKIFDHGIMIDYASTDRSRNIIRAICPNWQIVDSKNKYFDSDAVDREVEDYERYLTGWRICLNVTEFLYGNYKKLVETHNTMTYYLNSYVFIDLDNTNLTHMIPLHEQVTKGYKETKNRMLDLYHGFRTQRRMTNYFEEYHLFGGRHYYEDKALDDLFVFYYGYMNLGEQMVKRKLQIKDKISPEEIKKFHGTHMNVMTLDQIDRIIRKHHLPLATDLTDDIKPIIDTHKELTGSSF